MTQNQIAAEAAARALFNTSATTLQSLFNSLLEDQFELAQRLSTEPNSDEILGRCTGDLCTLRRYAKVLNEKLNPQEYE